MIWKKTFAGVFLSRLSIAILILIGGFTLPAWSQERLQTRYAVVLAESTGDLLEMERRLHISTATPTWQPRVTGEFAFHPGFARLAAKIDAILVRTSGLLNIRPSERSRLNIILVPNGKEVRRRHLVLVPNQPRGLFGYGSLEAFYEAYSRTIYLSLRDLRAGILAHEMAHYLFCTAVSPRPSSHFQEAWAQYVDSRL